MIIAATGHRPPKVGGYSTKARDRLVELAYAYLMEKRPELVISGMALGWDQAVAIAAIQLEIPFIAAIPFKGQEEPWPDVSRALYRKILVQAARIELTSEEYSMAAMQKRNEWMVDNCDKLMALWDGSPGGTHNCIDYANKKEKPWINLWSEYHG